MISLQLKRITKGRLMEKVIYCTAPESRWTVTAILAPVGPRRKQLKVLSIKGFGFFTTKDLKANLAGCLASVKDHDEHAHFEDIQQIRAVMLQFLEDSET
jgi:hypothetical protein